MSTKKYIARNLINHNGELYQAGDEIELDDKTAGQIKSALKPVVNKKAKAETGAKK